MNIRQVARVFAAASLVVVAGCGLASDEDRAEPPGPTSETTPAPEPSEGSVEPVSETSDDYGLLTDVRVAGHDGYDRVVFEFADGSLPGYTIEYTDLPLIEDGSGEEIDIPTAGTALRILFTPASSFDLISDTPGPSYEGPREFSPTDTSNIIHVVDAGDFEAQMVWAVGLASEVPFTVKTLQDPARVVIDLATS